MKKGAAKYAFALSVIVKLLTLDVGEPELS